MTTNLPAIHSHALGGLPASLAIEAGEFNEIEQARVALIVLRRKTPSFRWGM